MLISNKCTSCGGELIYDPDSEELKCNKCSNIVDIPEQNALAGKQNFSSSSTIKTNKTSFVQYHCSTCDAKHVVPTGQEITNCPSCGDSNLTQTNNIEYMPDGIIPFKLNKDKALACFVEWIKKRKFTPKALKKVSADKISGVYLPIYCYDFICHTSYSGVGINENRDKDGHVHTSSTHFSGTRDDVYNDYIDFAHSGANSSHLKKVSNFNFNNIYVYRTEFLYGWIGTEVNVPIQDSCRRSKAFVESDIKRKIYNEHHYDQITSFDQNTTFNKIAYNFLYVPIWMCNYKYKNKLYNTYINGTTGKVSGKTPKSFAKIFSLVFGICAVLGVIAYFIIKNNM